MGHQLSLTRSGFMARNNAPAQSTSNELDDALSNTLCTKQKELPVSSLIAHTKQLKRNVPALARQRAERPGDVTLVQRSQQWLEGSGGGGG